MVDDIELGPPLFGEQQLSRTADSDGLPAYLDHGFVGHGSKVSATAPYSLLSMVSFPLFGFRVTISPTFLILGLFLLDSRLGAAGLVAWVGAAFTSVLIHELGHAFAVRRAGGVVEGITLHALGGATAWSDPSNRIGWVRRIGIAAAGAGLGFVVAGVLFALVRLGVFGRRCRSFDSEPFPGVPGRCRPDRKSGESSSSEHSSG